MDPGNYFPFEIPRDLSSVGFTAADLTTGLGSVRIWTHFQPIEPESLFLHGVGMKSNAWGPLVLAADAAGVDTRGWVFLDIPGFGDSDPVARGVTLDDVSVAVDECLQQLEAGPVHVVGHSMGGFLALHLASTLTEEILSVVVLAGAYATIVDVVNKPFASAIEFPITTLGYAGLLAGAYLGPVAPALMRLGALSGALRATLVGTVAHPLRVPRNLLSALADGVRPKSFLVARATGRGYDYRETWGRIGIPVLAIFGSYDALVTNRDAELLQEAIPSAKVEWIKHAGHLIPMERPTKALRLVLKWRHGLGYP